MKALFSWSILLVLLLIFDVIAESIDAEWVTFFGAIFSVYIIFFIHPIKVLQAFAISVVAFCLAPLSVLCAVGGWGYSINNFMSMVSNFDWIYSISLIITVVTSAYIITSYKKR